MMCINLKANTHMICIKSEYTHDVYKSKSEQTHTHDVHQLKVKIHKYINLILNTHIHIRTNPKLNTHNVHKSKSEHTHVCIN